MQSVELPDDIANVLQKIAPHHRGAFLYEHGFSLPTAEQACPSPLTLPLDSTPTNTENKKSALLYTDGASRGNPGHAGAGYLLQHKNGEIIYEGRKYLGTTTNNVAEWTALLLGVEHAISQGITDLECFLDSELVVKQIKGAYKVKHPDLKPLHQRTHSLLTNFSHISFAHIPRAQNSHADRLSNEAIDRRS